MMKTLDEVIKKIEACIEADGHCPACPYEVSESCGDMDADALHYLKVLKDILDPLKVKKNSHEITCPQCQSKIAILLPESNEPLTWDELKQMEGKPVWVEYGTFSDSGWAFISEISEQGCIEFLLPWGLRLVMQKGAIGKTWQAYRKERE